MDPESVNQIVKAITSLHDGRTWKPETVVSAVAALAATSAATVTFILGKRQILSAQSIAQQHIASAQTVAKQQMESAQAIAREQAEAARAAAESQIDAAQAVAQKQIGSAQIVAQKQIESAQSVARQQLVMPMREAWIGQLRDKLATVMATCSLVFRDLEEETKEVVIRVGALRHEISLMTNPDEPEHILLDRAISELVNASATKPRDEGRYTNADHSMRRLAQKILQSEWAKASRESS